MLHTPPQSVRDTHRNGLLLGLHDRYIPPFSSGFLTSQAISRRRQLAKGICRPAPAGALLCALLGPARFLVGGALLRPSDWRSRRYFFRPTPHPDWLAHPRH